MNYLVHSSFSRLALYAFWDTMFHLDSPIQLQVSSSTVLLRIKLLQLHVFLTLFFFGFTAHPGLPSLPTHKSLAWTCSLRHHPTSCKGTIPAPSLSLQPTGCPGVGGTPSLSTPQPGHLSTGRTREGTTCYWLEPAQNLSGAQVCLDLSLLEVGLSMPKFVLEKCAHCCFVPGRKKNFWVT